MIKMSVKKLSIFLSFFLLLHKSNAFNITKILSQYPDFTTFNNYLTQTNLAGEINSRQTITVLAVENGNLSPLSGKPLNVIKSIISMHVILDYFDVPKLQKLSNSAILTTLFQTSGIARGQQGFINVTHLKTDGVAFGSAEPGSTPGSNLVKSISSQPYNISVLQVSNVIVPPGIDGSGAHGGPSASPAPSVSPTLPPAVSPATPTPVSPPEASLGPTPVIPLPPTVSPAATPGSPPVPADGPAADAPAADAPAAVAPAADAPDADAPAPDAPADKSSGAILEIGLGAVMTMVLSVFSFVSRI